MHETQRVALVTGGSRGIGAATALALAEAGMDIAIVSRSSGTEAASVQKRVEGAGRRCVSVQGDMAKPDDCRRAVSECVETFGRLDALIHNAGGSEPGTLFDDDIEEKWYRAFDIHVHAALHLCRAAVPWLQKRDHGAIVLVASVAGIRGVDGILPYSTVKGALYQMARSLASDLAPYAIRVNTVSPGIIRTDFHKNMSDEKKQYNLEHRIPLGAEGTPEQSADAIRLLVLNDYITGENLTIDGGLTMRIR